MRLRSVIIAGVGVITAGAIILAGYESGGPQSQAASTVAQPPTTGPFALTLASCATAIEPDSGSPTLEAIVQVRNTSSSVTATPDVQVKFLIADTVLGTNVNSTAQVGALSPGQSEIVYVWALNQSGNSLPTDGLTCRSDVYWALRADSTQEGPYAW